jgi:hypothetical protein
MVLDEPGRASSGSVPAGAQVPDAICPWIEQAARLRATLDPHTLAIRRCFGDTPWGSAWVEYAWPISLSSRHRRTQGTSKRAAACIDEVVARSAIDLQLGEVRSLFVMFGHEAPGHHGKFGETGAHEPVHADARAVGACYQAAMKARPTREGGLVVELVAGADGSVPVARTVGSELDDPALECCINAAVVSTWKYAPLPGPYRLFRRFRFEQRSARHHTLLQRPGPRHPEGTVAHRAARP